MLLMVNLAACGGLGAKIPTKVCGLTFTAYGFDVSSYYRREPDSKRKECAWMFKGIGSDEIIGDFGLVGGGAVQA